MTDITKGGSISLCSGHYIHPRTLSILYVTSGVGFQRWDFINFSQIEFKNALSKSWVIYNDWVKTKKPWFESFLKHWRTIPECWGIPIVDFESETSAFSLFHFLCQLSVNVVDDIKDRQHIIKIGICKLTKTIYIFDLNLQKEFVFDVLQNFVFAPSSFEIFQNHLILMDCDIIISMNKSFYTN